MKTLTCEMSWRALLDTCRSHGLPFGKVKVQVGSAMVRLVHMTEHRDSDMSYDPDHVYVEFEALSEVIRMESTDPVFVMFEAHLVPDGNDFDPYKTPSPDVMPPYQVPDDDGDYDQVPDDDDDDDEYEEDELAESWHAAPADDDDDDEYNYDYGYDEYGDHECNDPDASVLPNHCGETASPAGSAAVVPDESHLVDRRVTFWGDGADELRSVTKLKYSGTGGSRHLIAVRVTTRVGWKHQTNWMSIQTFLSRLMYSADHSLYHAAAMPPVDGIPF